MPRVITFRIRFIVEPDDGGFYAHVPELKGVRMSGETREEAIENAKIAVELMLESYLRAGDPLPIGIMASEQTIGQMLSGTLQEMLHRLWGKTGEQRSAIIQIPMAVG